MKCPYTVNIQQHHQTTYEFDEDGKLTNEVSVLLETRPFVDCLMEECSAWCGGRCQYKGAID